jgi:uncharacterized protein (UPF0333 family)
MIKEEKAQVSVEVMLLIVAAVLAVAVVALFIKGVINSSSEALR